MLGREISKGGNIFMASTHVIIGLDRAWPIRGGGAAAPGPPHEVKNLQQKVIESFLKS
jgi:hypothetical protein